tara:strand:- start:11350 stop:11649 length:300 start_codon:yes stop_codon:yes gene_type:complete
MKKLNAYKYYVLDKLNSITQIEREDIKNEQVFLYITTTPTTPPDLEFMFCLMVNGESEYIGNSLEIEYAYSIVSQNRLIEISNIYKIRNREKNIKKILK